MIGTGLITTTILCLGLSTNGVLNNSTPFLNQDNKVIEKEPQLATGYEDGKYTYNFIENYTMEINEIRDWDYNANLGPEQPQLYYKRFDISLNNEILDIRANVYETYITWRNENYSSAYPNSAWILPEENAFGQIQTGIVEIYQITPYKYTYENQFKIKIENYLTNNVSINGKTKYKKTTYITTENLSSYLDRTDFYTPYWIANLEETIQNPNIGYQYTKQTNIIEIEDSYNDETWYKQNNIYTEYEIIGNQTNYILNFYYLDPTIQDRQLPEDYENKYEQFFLTSRYSWLHYMNLETSGNFIPPIENYEVVDIAGLMFNILTLPFSFISVAFNLTLFPGTMYQINLANLFLAIIGVLIFIFVINILIKRK